MPIDRTPPQQSDERHARELGDKASESWTTPQTGNEQGVAKNGTTTKPHTLSEADRKEKLSQSLVKQYNKGLAMKKRRVSSSCNPMRPMVAINFTDQRRLCRHVVVVQAA